MSGGWEKRRIEEKKFLEKMRRAGPPSSLFLAGPEILLRDALMAEFGRAVLGSAEGGRWNREVYSSRETPLSEIASGLRCVGLFAPTRLVIVHEVERYGRSSKADREDLWEWCDRPSPGIHLVLLSEKPLWELERANEFLKGTLRRADAVVPLDHPTFDRAVELIRRAAAKRHDLDLPEESARRLVEAVGPNLLELAHELERLALRLGPGSRVDTSLLENWLRTGIVGNIADLERALTSGDRPMALRYWATVRRQLNAPAVTWILGSRHLQPRWRGSRSSAAAPSGPFLSSLLQECYRFEFGVKTGRIPSSLQESAFEAVIWEICEKRRAAAQRRPDGTDGSRDGQDR